MPKLIIYFSFVEVKNTPLEILEQATSICSVKVDIQYTTSPVLWTFREFNSFHFPFKYLELTWPLHGCKVNQIVTKSFWIIKQILLLTFTKRTIMNIYIYLH